MNKSKGMGEQDRASIYLYRETLTVEAANGGCYYYYYYECTDYSDT